jgi:glycosyltransferase involved in cell wall biosynthesis
MIFSLLYLAKPKLGGWVTFTAHLAHLLKQKGGLVGIYRVGKRFERKNRDFGWNLAYQNIPCETLRSLPNPIITAFDKSYYHLLPYLRGMRLVMHDPTEIKPDIVPYLKEFKIITIRRQMQNLLLKKYGIQSVNINHPFYQYPLPPPVEKKEVVAISRIDFDKHTEIILKANQILEKEGFPPIKIYGVINPIYEFHKLKGLNLRKYWHGEFGKSFASVGNILAPARFMVDMTAIKNDGAGTQYTFLEAIYSGAVLILNKKWFENGIEILRPGENCFAVENEMELADLIMHCSEENVKKIAENAKAILSMHDLDFSIINNA